MFIWLSRIFCLLDFEGRTDLVMGSVNWWVWLNSFCLISIDDCFFFFDDFIGFARASNMTGSGDGIRLIIGESVGGTYKRLQWNISFKYLF